ncbi:hypothetical protein GF325_09160, partial [Candidatus Bathyarchaeota archaeon]|nr:hypothetical protein [Candidatus Bathyarchaeota archaeon]
MPRWLKKRRKSEKKIHPDLNWINITPQEGHYLFGYYDRNPFSIENRFHLALKVPHDGRLPLQGETAEVGVIDIAEREFIRITSTEAWCHQQGAMTQWIPGKKDRFIFNDAIPRTLAGKTKINEGWKLISRVHDVNGNHVRDMDFPIYIISHNGRWGITLDFSRIPRRGYSYARAPLPSGEPLPNIDRDGVFLVNLDTGEKKLVLSYRQVLEAPDGPVQQEHPDELDERRFYHWMNHAS